MKKNLAALALLSAVAIPLPAHAGAIISFGGTTAVPDNNDFQGLLAGLGLTQYASTGASIVLSGASTITFEFLGTESGYDDNFATISAPSLSYTEYTTSQDNFGFPILIGSADFAAGSLTGLLNFSAVGGAPATVGDRGFAIFLGPNQRSGDSVSTFYFGYDDQLTGPDDDYDDMIIRATVTAAVPEPATWAMMLVGFFALGATMRHRQVPARALARAS